MPSINNFLKGFTNGLPGMKDFRHASRLYIDDNYKLMPKQKFLFHVVFSLNDDVSFDKFSTSERYELNMLVKSCDLPRFNMNTEEKTQYNKKMYASTRIAYDPVTITFHDDHADTVNAFWKKYYEYNIADSVAINSDMTIDQTKDNAYDARQTMTKFGMDTPKRRRHPFLRGIEIFVLHKQRFTSMTLANPIIGSFNHDNLDQADGTGVLQNQMQILYETVIYKAGIINKNNVPGFATVHYDHEPSPLSMLGRGTTSIFGPGGIVNGVGSVIRSVQSGNYLGAILGAVNTYNNAKKIKKGGIKEELKGIVKEGVLEVGKSAGTITNPVGNFNVGSTIATGVAAAVTIASMRGTADNKNRQDNTTISNPKIDTVTNLSADESYKLITANDIIKNKVASALYYKDIGSRKGLTIAESDIEYAGSTASTKIIYRSKSISNIRKLVTEGYIKINRASQDVTLATEKATI